MYKLKLNMQVMEQDKVYWTPKSVQGERMCDILEHLHSTAKDYSNIK